MSKAKVSSLLCIGRLVSKTDNVMHFACLVEQASATRFCDLFVYGAYMVHHSMRVGTVRAFSGRGLLAELILIELPS